MLIKNNRNKLIGGFTLIETLVVVSVGIIFVALSLGMFRTISSDVKIRVESENLKTMFVKLDAIYKDTRSVSLNNSFALKSNVVPKNMDLIGDNIKHSWRGNVIIEGYPNEENSFSIKYTKVPDGKHCGKLIKAQKMVGWDRFFIGSEKLSYMDYDPVKALKACSKKSKTGVVDIIFDKSIEVETPPDP